MRRREMIPATVVGDLDDLRASDAELGTSDDMMSLMQDHPRAQVFILPTSSAEREDTLVSSTA